MSTCSYLVCDHQGCAAITKNDGSAGGRGWHKGAGLNPDYCDQHRDYKRSMTVSDPYLGGIEASAEHVLSMCKAIREGKAG